MSLHTPSQGRPRVPLPRVLPPGARKKVEAAARAHSDALEALIAFLDEFEDELEDEHDGREDGHDREMVCEDEGADEHADAGMGRGSL